MKHPRNNEEYETCFGLVQTPTHRGWPIHGQVILRKKWPFHDWPDYFLFSVDAVRRRMKKLFEVHFYIDERLPLINPPETIEAWAEETQRMVEAARAAGLPERETQLDRVWNFWGNTMDGGQFTRAKNMTEIVLGNWPRSEKDGDERLPSLRVYDVDEPGFLEKLPGDPRVIHGRIDIGHDHSHCRVNGLFFSRAGAIYSLQQIYNIGLLTDEDIARITLEIEASILPITEGRTRADRVVERLAGEYHLYMFAGPLSHVLGVASTPGQAIWNSFRNEATIYLWDDWMVTGEYIRTLDRAEARLRGALSEEFILQEEYEHLLEEVRKLPFPDNKRDLKQASLSESLHV